MFPYRKSQRTLYPYQALVGGASPDAGTRQYNGLQTTAQQERLVVRIDADLITTVAGTAIRNRGSLAAAFVEMGLDENGTDAFKLDARALRQLAEYSIESKLTSSRLQTVNVGTTHLTETFVLHFAHPRSLQPRETAFLAKDPKQQLRFFHTLNQTGNGVGQILQGGTATLSNVKVRVIQHMNEYETTRPLFIPRIRQIGVAITQAQSGLELNVIASQWLRGILIQQDSSLGEVNDIINSMAVLGDARHIIGPEMADFDTLARSQELAYGGDVYGGGNGYYYLDFQPNGRLSEVYNTSQDNNLRIKFDCQPTALAGAVASYIRVVLIELVRDPSAVTPDGRPLVEKLEIPV